MGRRNLVLMPSRYEEDLQAIERDMVTLFAMVSGAVSSGVGSLVEGDRLAGRIVVERDVLIDSLYLEIEDLARETFALHAPAALDMKYLLSVLRIVPELERSGDLAEHIGKRAARGTFDGLPDRVMRIMARMGDVVEFMWQALNRSYRERNTLIYADLRRLDEEVDELHVLLIAEIVAQDLPTRLAIELGLTGRFLERLGDHAVHIGRRVSMLNAGVPSQAGVNERT